MSRQLRDDQSSPSDEQPQNRISPPAEAARTSLSKVAWIGTSVLLLVAVAIGLTIAVSRGLSLNEPKILIVQSPVADSSLVSGVKSGEDVGSGNDERADAEQERLDTSSAQALQEASSEPVGKAAATRGENKGGTRGNAAQSEVAKLTEAFKREERKIRECFESHALELEGTPEISFRFEVAPDGAIRNAWLSPTSLASTTLGKCLKRVALGTQFPRLSQSASFSIPVKARRTQP